MQLCVIPIFPLLRPKENCEFSPLLTQSPSTFNLGGLFCGTVSCCFVYNVFFCHPGSQSIRDVLAQHAQGCGLPSPQLGCPMTQSCLSVGVGLQPWMAAILFPWSVWAMLPFLAPGGISQLELVVTTTGRSWWATLGPAVICTLYEQ